MFLDAAATMFAAAAMIMVMSMAAAAVGVFVFGNAFTAADFAGFALVFFMLCLISRREKTSGRRSQVTRRVSSRAQEKKLAS